MDLLLVPLQGKLLGSPLQDRRLLPLPQFVEVGVDVVDPVRDEAVQFPLEQFPVRVRRLPRQLHGAPPDWPALFHKRRGWVSPGFGAVRQLLD